MTTRNVAIRIGVTGKEDAKRDVAEVGTAGAQAGANIAKSFDAAGVATDRETQKLQRLAQAAKQAADASAAQAKFNSILGVGTGASGSARESAKVFEAAAKATEDLEARTRALRAQIDPLGAAQARLNIELEEANSLFRSGAITATEQAAAHRLAQTRFETTAAALKNVGEGSRLAAHQITNLGFQLNDVVVGLASGQRPLTVLVQQGTQIAQVFSGSGLGVGAILKELGKTVARLISPTTALVGGLAAVGLTAVAAYQSYVTAQKELEVATQGIGRAAGATVERLNEIAESAAEAGDVSVKSAREMEVAFLRSGNIGVSLFESLIVSAKDYAATTSQEIDAATEELAKAFADPARGVDILNAKVGGFDDKTRQLIKTLAAQNDTLGAQRLLLANLRPSLVDAEESTTALGRAWDAVARAASNAMNAIGSAVNSSVTAIPLDQQLQTLKNEMTMAALGRGTPVNTARGPVITPPRPIAQIQAEIDAIQKQINDTQQRTAQAATDAQAAKSSAAAGDIARALTPGFNDLQALKNQQAQLSKALNDPAARERLADLKQTEEAYNAVSRAIETYLDPAERAKRLDELQVRALDAKTPAQKADIAAQRRRIELAGQAVTIGQAEADIARAGAQARTEANKAIETNSAVLSANAKAAVDVANAYLQGAVAARELEARRKALTESIRSGIDVEKRTREIIDEDIAAGVVQAAKSADDIAAQAVIQERLNNLVERGKLSSEKARQQMQIEQQLRPLMVSLSLAEGEAKEALLHTIDALWGAYDRLNAAESRNAALGKIESQDRQIFLLGSQLRLAGMKEDQARRELVLIETQQELLANSIDLSSQEAALIQAKAINIDILNGMLERTRAAMQELQSITESTFNHFGDLIAEGNADWNSWADAGRAAILDINREMVKLALLNPVKNWLFGQNNPTVSDVGGLLSGIFGEPSSASNQGHNLVDPGPEERRKKPFILFHGGGTAGFTTSQTRDLFANLYDRIPRFHSGAFLAPDEVPAILQRGERVLDRNETKRYNRGFGDAAPVYVTIQTPDPAAFRASRTQVSADLARAVRMGMRGN